MVTGVQNNKCLLKVSYGKIYFENRKGISGHNHNPYFILDKDATETTGEVYFGALKLTGNFKGVVEQTPYGETLVQMGINDFDFLIYLENGQSIETPHMVIGYTDKGLESIVMVCMTMLNKYILKKRNKTCTL